MKSTMLGRISQMADGIGDVGGPQYALSAYRQIVQSCAYTADTSGVPLASTAYGALVSGRADSRGLALAFSALCAKGSIETRVVDGTLDGAAHSWNLVLLDGAWYQVDVSQNSTVGAAGAFMRTDREMRQRYAWDAAAYPPCTTERPAAVLGG